MKSKYSEAYKAGSYDSIISNLNPENKPDKEILYEDQFIYAWSLYKSILSQIDFESKIRPVQFDYVVNEILRNMPSDHLIVSLVKKKVDKYYGNKGKPTKNILSYKVLMVKNKPNNSNDLKIEDNSYNLAPYGTFEDDYEGKYSKEDLDYDDLTAREQGNL